MLSPAVSILMPTYNRSALLPRAIASALSQTCTDFELLVIDDGSTDDTKAVVSSFRDPRIRYLRQNHAGAAAAENHGVREARGRFVGFLDDDDEWLPDKLRRQLACFAQADETTAVVYTGCHIFRNGRVIYGPDVSILANDGWIHREILNRTTFVPLVCALVRKDRLLEVGGFDADLPTSNDYDLWIRLSDRYRFRYLPEPLVRVHASTRGSLSTRPDLIVPARMKLLAKHAEKMAGIGRRVGVFFHWQIGSLLVLQGDLSRGRRYLFSAARHAPWRPLYVFGAIASLFGRRPFVKGVLEPSHRARHFWSSRKMRPVEAAR